MLRRLGSVIAVVALVVFSAGACNGTTTDVSSSYPSASCNACHGASYTEADCAAFGRAGGCETSTFVAAVPGCTNGCKFSNCHTAPDCSPHEDAGSGIDAAADPKCAAANANPLGKGLFSEKPDCPSAHEGNINGSVVWTCPCGSSCPCGYQCGSIALKVGGSIGSVCAPE